MLTFQDCLGFSELSLDELEEIARHEHLPIIVALEKADEFLHHAWGRPALRQMLRDRLMEARKRHDPKELARLMSIYARACRRLGGGIDRRHVGAKDHHVG